MSTNPASPLPPSVPPAAAPTPPRADPGVGSAYEPAPVYEPVSGVGQERRRGQATPVLAVLLAAALALGAYLWVTTERWRETSAEWEAKAGGYAREVADLRLQLDGVNAELTSAREQLATATDRITDLANEKAQLGDENVASQQYLEYQRRVSEAAGVVATALGQCTDGQQELIGYLKDADSYDPADLERFESQVTDLCTQAKDANTALQQELEQ